MPKRVASPPTDLSSAKRSKTTFSVADLLSPSRVESPAFSIAAAFKHADAFGQSDGFQSEEADRLPVAAAAQPPQPYMMSAGASASMSSIHCALDNDDLWAAFHKLQTEMIITKSGRRMFPTVKVKLEGCVADADYYVFLDVVPVDAKRYRYTYNKSSWLTAGKAEPPPKCGSRLYMHPDSPFSPRQLATQAISFEKAKLTNNEVVRPGHLVLNSMHKYQPRVHVVRRCKGAIPLSPMDTDVDLSNDEYKTFSFPETQFMAVTAYQNQLVTKLKIDKNPFAKGFRDPTGRNVDLGDLPQQMGDRPMDAATLATYYAWQQAGLPPLAGFPMPPFGNAAAFSQMETIRTVMAALSSMPPPLLQQCPPVNPANFLLAMLSSAAAAKPPPTAEEATEEEGEEGKTDRSPQKSPLTSETNEEEEEVDVGAETAERSWNSPLSSWS